MPKSVPGGVAGDYKEERLDVFQFFSRSCFEDFDDGPKGFYTVFRHAFEEIAAEERRASGEYSTSSSEESASFPTFGKSDSDYDSVVRSFYTFWEGFATRKSYSWVERYDTRRLSSRIERRAAETENRKAREAAKKERNEEVRQLVAYVRRRDKRLEAQRERLAAAAKHAHVRNQEQANKTRQKNAADLERAWAHEMATGGLAAQWADEFEAELARIEAEIEGKNGRKSGVLTTDGTDSSNGDTNEEEEDDDNEMYCIACDKSFASLAAKRNHEASKKHKKQVELLREVLLEEERLAAVEAGSEIEEQIDKEFSESEAGIRPVDAVKLTKRAKRSLIRQQRANEKAEKEVVLPEAPKNEGNDKNEVVKEATETDLPNKPNRKDKTKAPPPPLPNNPPNVCLICMEEFPSRNKLFNHIEMMGHAAIRAAPQTVSRRSKRKR
uniref:DnaJ subfamily C 1 n=1 Tax=Echinococcus granulosus TaxID=6210 RepID=A0A068WSG2_ECHGR|nr:dnaJ subfamily C 1 [Echinococcus granulosus]